jgi:hypothetical protein
MEGRLADRRRLCTGEGFVIAEAKTIMLTEREKEEAEEESAASRHGRHKGLSILGNMTMLNLEACFFLCCIMLGQQKLNVRF